MPCSKGRRERSRSPFRRGQGLLDQRQHPASSQSGSGELFFEVQVVSAASGRELCLLQGSSSWTVLSIKTAIAESLAITEREVRLLYQGDILDDGKQLNDLEFNELRQWLEVTFVSQHTPTLIVSYVRLPAYTELRQWLESLDAELRQWPPYTRVQPGLKSSMFDYWDPLVTEFGGDLKQIAASKIPSAQRQQPRVPWAEDPFGLLRMVDPSFWERIKVKKIHHKMVFARAIVKLAACTELRQWLESLDTELQQRPAYTRLPPSLKSSMLDYWDPLVSEFDGDLNQIAAVTIPSAQRQRPGLLGMVAPSFWQSIKVKKTFHKMVFARAIAKLAAARREMP